MNENMEVLQPETEKAAAGKPAGENKLESSKHLLVINIIEKLLIKAKARWNQGFFDENAAWVEKVGHYCVLLSAVLGFLAGLISAIKFDQMTPLGIGIIWMFTLLVLQFIAHKFIVASAKLIKSTESQMSSPSFLDSLSVVNILVGFGCLIGGIFLAIKTSDWTFVISGIMMFWAFEYFASLSMNPKMLNINVVEQATAGQEAIGLISFFMKGMLKLVPVYFGTWMVIGTFHLIDALITLIGKNSYMFMEPVTTASYAILAALLSPFVIYLVFMFQYLFLDVINSILDIPAKIGSISKNQ